MPSCFLRMPEHIVVSVDSVDEAHNFHVGKSVAEYRGTPVVVIFAFGAAGEGSSQYGGNQRFQIP